MARQRTPEELIHHREYMKKHRKENIDKQREKERQQREKLRTDPERHKAYLEYQRQYRIANKEKLSLLNSEWRDKKKLTDPEYQKRQNKRTLNFHHQLRKEAFAAYGNKCACCGETIEHFLSIDHINNNGAEHRRSIGKTTIYGWLKKNNYPAGFQVLCMNCNMGKARNGGICPHVSTVKER